MSFTEQCRRADEIAHRRVRDPRDRQTLLYCIVAERLRLMLAEPPAEAPRCAPVGLDTADLDDAGDELMVRERDDRFGVR